MRKFSGFPDGYTHFTSLPEQFFTDLLPLIDDLNELKLLLHIFWRLNQMEGTFRYLLHEEMINDQRLYRLLTSSNANQEQAKLAIENALILLVKQHILLEIKIEVDHDQITLYFLNSAKGRAAVAAIRREEWQPTKNSSAPLKPIPARPNIFRLYEENIGPITPLLSESLAEAEDTYPKDWIEDAIRIAVEKNKRNWRYISAILNSWQEKGRYERKDRQDAEKDRQRYKDWED